MSLFSVHYRGFPRRGAVSLAPGTLEYLKEVRLFLETGTARMAAERATEEDVARLRLAVAKHRASMVKLERFYRA